MFEKTLKLLHPGGFCVALAHANIRLSAAIPVSPFAWTQI